MPTLSTTPTSRRRDRGSGRRCGPGRGRPSPAPGSRVRLGAQQHGQRQPELVVERPRRRDGRARARPSTAASRSLVVVLPDGPGDPDDGRGPDARSRSSHAWASRPSARDHVGDDDGGHVRDRPVRRAPRRRRRRPPRPRSRARRPARPAPRRTARRARTARESTDDRPGRRPSPAARRPARRDPPTAVGDLGAPSARSRRHRRVLDRARRSTTRSSNGQHDAADLLPGLVPLARRPRRRRRAARPSTATRDRRGPVGLDHVPRRARAGGPTAPRAGDHRGEDRAGSSERGLSSVSTARSAPRDRGRAHQRPLVRGRGRRRSRARRSPGRAGERAQPCPAASSTASGVCA